MPYLGVRALSAWCHAGGETVEEFSLPREEDVSQLETLLVRHRTLPPPGGLPGQREVGLGRKEKKAGIVREGPFTLRAVLGQRSSGASL